MTPIYRNEKHPPVKDQPQNDGPDDRQQMGGAVPSNHCLRRETTDSNNGSGWKLVGGGGGGLIPVCRYKMKIPSDNDGVGWEGGHDIIENLKVAGSG